MSDAAVLSAPSDRVSLWVLVLVLVILAFLNRFMQDDAFISFRYADNLVQGHGLVWNVGERVEGYTNFLWTVLMALPMALGRDPVTFSQALGLVLAAGTLTVTYRLARLITGSTWASLIAVAFLGTNYSFSAYATGGLETQLQGLLIASCVVVGLALVNDDRWTWPHLVSLSILAALALLTRLDSALVLVVICAVVAWQWVRRPQPMRTRIGHAVVLLTPALAILSVWCVWKILYYGSVLPNTAYVKAASTVPPKLGLAYLFKFADSYLLFPMVFLLLFFVRELVTRKDTGALLTIIGLWCIYIVKVGGDFMEFRFIVPVLPLLFTLFAFVITRVSDPRVQAALCLVILTGSVSHALRFHGTTTGVESIRTLERHLTDPDQAWVRIGEVLGEFMNADGGDVTIATTAAGAIPYYSRLETIDMHGLNDRWLAHHGPHMAGPAGHQTYAPLRYLRERGTNLVIGHPRVDRVTADPDPRYTVEDVAGLGVVDVRERPLAPEARMVRIPLSADTALVALYLVANPRIDQLIADGRIRAFPILPR